MMSHITSSIPSAPASRTYSTWGSLTRLSGSAVSLSRKRVSNSRLMSPARGPCSWCDMPPVPKIMTSRSSSKDSTAFRIARPRFQQRLPVGGGYWTTFTASGITFTGHSFGRPNSSDNGTVRPWSTSILLTIVMSNSSRIVDCAMCHASSGCPSTTGTGRGPQPSSAGAKRSAQPIANVGIISSENADAWSL